MRIYRMPIVVCSVFGIGVGVGYLLRGGDSEGDGRAGAALDATASSEPKRPLISPLVPARKSKIVPPEGGREVQTEATRNEIEVVTLPRSILGKVLPSPFFPGSTTLNPAAFLNYGITPEDTLELCEQIQSHIAEFHRLEAQHSRLVDDPKKGQYFKVDAFPSEAEALFSGVKQIIEDQLGGFADDRGELLYSQIANSWEFDDKGNFPKEIYFAEEVDDDGGVRHRYNIVYDHDRNPEAPSSWVTDDLGQMKARHPGLLQMIPEPEP